MDYRVEWIDVSEHLRAGIQPAFVIRRDTKRSTPFNSADPGSSEEHWVPQGSVFENNDWAVCRSGDFVRVPIFAYKTPQAAMASIFGLGIQIGVTAIEAVRMRSGAPVIGLTLVLGHDVTDLRPSEDSFRVYIGIAAQTR